MAGEPILVVDDTPVNLRLTRILLLNEGYKVLTAASAEEALDLLRTEKPALILADIQLPGIDGLEMTRRIKQDLATSQIIVVALTAFAMKDDEQRAIEAGCDGYITKPIDTRSLGRRIRGILDSRGEAGSAVLAPAGSSSMAEQLSTPELLLLRRRFLAEGQEKARQLLADLDGPFNAGEAARLVHQWIGAGGLLGYPAISSLAREIERIMLERPIDSDLLRESLGNVMLAFTIPREARDTPVHESIAKSLAGKVIAVAGLPNQEAQRLCVALERVDARLAFFDHVVQPVAAALETCDLLVLYVRHDGVGTGWIASDWSAHKLPLVLVGGRDHLQALDPAVQSRAREFLMDSWQPDEALVRLSLAITQASGDRAAPRLRAVDGHVRVLIADDDTAILAQVRTALESAGVECEVAADGRAAIEAVRASKPHAAVLDVDLPGMDGCEVLAAIRAEELPTRVLLLTARQQESDVIRGFSLGADDYVVKPFSPMELVARLKRLIETEI
ncbi:MAG TPA: response regulator [Candidatus Acidoferrum sp.]|nr:response regulator [Candidatus Acidoferrum sp.]